MDSHKNNNKTNFDQSIDHATVAPDSMIFKPEGKKLQLSDLRADLIRLEETIIFALIERSQFRLNPPTYKPGAIIGSKKSAKLDENSFLEFLLSETEKVHSLMRRYTSPDENPFFPNQLPEPIIPLLTYPSVLHHNTVNLNSKLLSLYISRMLPLITRPGDDQQYGSSANCDIVALQALSKRVHYGKFVAEAKFQEDPDGFSKLINAKDIEGVTALLRNVAVEKKLLERVRLKACTYNLELSGDDPSNQARVRVDPDRIVDIYEQFIIPLTIEVEVEYLLQRLGAPTVAYLGPEGTFSQLAAQTYFGESFKFVPRPTIPGVFTSVLSNQTTYGIVPFENSIGGKVHPTVMGLLNEAALVSGELYLGISHHLVSKPLESSSETAKKSLSNIKRVYSHPQALSQCNNFLLTNCVGAETIPVESTAMAALRALEDPESAAITSSMAASTYGLQVLRSDIQDEANNVTRFFVIGKSLPVPSGHDQTMIVFGTENASGKLGQCLDIFTRQNINLTAIDSFASRQDPSKTNFLLQIQGHASEEPLKSALKDLEQLASSFRIVGAFAEANKRSDN